MREEKWIKRDKVRRKRQSWKPDSGRSVFTIVETIRKRGRNGKKRRGQASKETSQEER